MLKHLGVLMFRTARSRLAFLETSGMLLHGSERSFRLQQGRFIYTPEGEQRPF